MGADTTEHRSEDTTSMLNYAFTTYKVNNILTKDKIIGEIFINKGRVSKGTMSVKEDVTDLIKQNEDKSYTYNIVKNNIVAPVNKGDVVGKLEVIDNSGKIIKTVDLVINESVKKHNFFSLYFSFFKKIINGYL